MINFSFNYVLALLERKLRTGNYENHFIFENVFPLQSEHIQEMVSFYCKEKLLKPFYSTPKKLYYAYSKPLLKLPGDFYKKSFSYDLLVLSKLETLEEKNVSIVRNIVAQYLADNKIVVLISTNTIDKKSIIPDRSMDGFICC